MVPVTLSCTGCTGLINLYRANFRSKCISFVVSQVQLLINLKTDARFTFGLQKNLSISQKRPLFSGNICSRIKVTRDHRNSLTKHPLYIYTTHVHPFAHLINMPESEVTPPKHCATFVFHIRRESHARHIYILCNDRRARVRLSSSRQSAKIRAHTNTHTRACISLFWIH